MSCNACFRDSQLSRAAVEFPQPRFVAPNYWKTNPRTLVVISAPGSGVGRLDQADERLRKLLRAYADGTGSLDEIFQHQKTDFGNWTGGKFHRFFFEQLGLSADEIAFLNIAWCATAENKYPDWMLSNCWERYTRDLISCLHPQRVLLSGSAATKFREKIIETCPDLESGGVIQTLHYAHRKGLQIEANEICRVRNMLYQ